MAARYWVGGSATWDTTAGTKWATTSGGAGGASVPTAADDVFLDAASGAVTVTTFGPRPCRSLTCTGFTGTLALANSANTLTIGDAGGGALTLVAGMTLTFGASTTIKFVSTSDNGGAGWPITTAGKTMPGITFDDGVGTGKWTQQDAISMGATTLIVHNSGEWNTNSQSVTAAAINSLSVSTRTWRMGSSAITCSTSGLLLRSTGLTIPTNTATITCTGSSVAIASGAINMNGASLVLSGVGSFGVTDAGGGGANTWANVTRNGTAVKTDALLLGVGLVVTGTLTLAGNSATNRLLVTSATLGTQQTITANGSIVPSNLDFRDIVGAGSASWNLSAITGGAGDAQGNSGITFTTATTRYAVAAGSTSSTAMWSTTSGGAGGASVPLPQDDIVFNASSGAGTYTVDMPRLGKNWTLTGFTRTLAWATTEIYGSITLGSGMTMSGTSGPTFVGRGSHTITSAGKTWTPALLINAVTGTYTLADDYRTSRISASQALSGTFSDGGFNLFFSGTGGTFQVLGGTVIMSATSTWTFSTTTAVSFFSYSSGTVTCAAGNVISLIGSSTNVRTFAGGGQTYGILRFTVAQAGAATLAITGNNTFADIQVSNASGARTLRLPAGGTQTITATHGLTGVFGISGSLVSVVSSTAGTPATIALPNGYGGGSDWLSVQDITATTNPWYAGANSTNVSGNTNVIFTAVPVIAVMAATLGALTATAAATPTVNATLAAVLGSLTAQMSATVVEPATLAAPLGGLTASMSAGVSVPATATAPLGALTASMGATVTVPGTLAAPLGALVATAVATPTVDATLAAPLGALTAQAAGDISVPAALSAPLGALIATAAADVAHPAVLDAPLGGLTASASADLTHPATLAAPLGALTATVAADVTVSAVLSAPLGALSASAAATVDVDATLAAPLGALTAAAAGTVTPGSSTVDATLAAPLGGLTAAVSADVTVAASLAAPLGGLVAHAAASVAVAGTLHASLGGLTAHAAATPTVHASLAAPLGAVTAHAGATVTVRPTAAAPLGALSAHIAATASEPATMHAALGALAAHVNAEVARAAALHAPLGPLQAQAGALITQAAVLSAVLGGLHARMVSTQAFFPPYLRDYERDNRRQYASDSRRDYTSDNTREYAVAGAREYATDNRREYGEAR